MNLSGAIRARSPRSLRRHIVAALLTAIVLPALAALFLWQFPAGCDLRGDPATYRWTCLLPGMLVTVPVGVAVVLTIALALNRRLARPLPDGWLVIIPGAGLVAQIVLFGGYLLTLDAAYRAIFLEDLLLIPQPFVAGALSGAFYWVALHWGPDER